MRRAGAGWPAPAGRWDDVDGRHLRAVGAAFVAVWWAHETLRAPPSRGGAVVGAAMPRLLSAEQVVAYERDGFVKCDNWLDGDEVLQLLSIAKADKAFTDAGRDLMDDAGNVSRLSLRMWELPEDSYSAFVRHGALVRPIEQLLGDRVYHYHHKLMLKEPRTGGAWEWQCVPHASPVQAGHSVALASVAVLTVAAAGLCRTPVAAKTMATGTATFSPVISPAA